MSRRQGLSGSRVLGVDSDVLVHWAMAGAAQHRAVRECFEREVGERGQRLGIAQQTLNEFLHVVTDPRRFEHPLPMAEALRFSRDLWHRQDVERISPTDSVHDRLCELMAEFRLGRKRILDTALAASLEAAGVSRLATLNSRDFKIFPFIEIVDPRRPAESSSAVSRPDEDGSKSSAEGSRGAAADIDAGPPDTERE